MSQIKVKAYGLVPFTKKQYLIMQAIVFGILFVCLYFALRSYFNNADNILWTYAYIGIAIIIFLEILETLYMMIKFKKAETQATSD